ncbi:hypothetical protein C5167_030007 [Papaver somniferum]|nr:hypothetical protein C5167_030007 [Papaver somniferum]
MGSKSKTISSSCVAAGEQADLAEARKKGKSVRTEYLAMETDQIAAERTWSTSVASYLGANKDVEEFALPAVDIQKRLA